MIGCVDVHYENEKAFVGVVLFENWSSERALSLQRIEVKRTNHPYVPGEFYRRELPCIMSALDRLPQLPDLLIIDGYVWLNNEEGDQRNPGLGAHLFNALDKRIPIIGVAKSLFSSDCGAIAVRRGSSKNSLYVSAAGVEVKAAADGIATMHGAHRLPTMIRLADQLARGVHRV